MAKKEKGPYEYVRKQVLAYRYTKRIYNHEMADKIKKRLWKLHKELMVFVRAMDLDNPEMEASLEEYKSIAAWTVAMALFGTEAGYSEERVAAEQPDAYRRTVNYMLFNVLRGCRLKGVKPESMIRKTNARFRQGLYSIFNVEIIHRTRCYRWRTVKRVKKEAA